MCKRRQRLVLLVRRNVGRHEKHARKIAAFTRGPRQCQVPTVDGVEGPAEKANIHAPLVSSFTDPVGKPNPLEGNGRWSRVAGSVRHARKRRESLFLKNLE